MAINNEQYEVLAKHILDSCSYKEVQEILGGNFLPLKNLILDELLLNDYQGVISDIIFEDLFTQKKKPILKKHLAELADFMMSDLSLYVIKYNLSKMSKK